MSTEELVRRFRVEDVGKAAAIFDEKKLRWLNGRYMREMPLDEYTAAVARHLGREPDERLRAACAIAQEKAQTLDEVWPLIRFLFEPPVDDPKAWKKVMKPEVAAPLEAAAEALAAAEPFEPEAIEAALAPLLERFDLKAGRLYQPIRVAITGSSVSPGIFESLAVLGRRRALRTNPRRARTSRRSATGRIRRLRAQARILRLNHPSPAADVQGNMAATSTQPAKLDPPRSRHAPNAAAARATAAPRRRRRPRQPPRRRLRGGRALPGPDRVPRAGDRRRHRRQPRIGELVEAVESDVSLTISVLRFANRSGLVAGGVACDPRRDRGAEALRRPGDRRHRAQLRLLRVQRRLGAEARALPRPRPRHPAGRRPDRPHRRLARTRRARRRRPPARRRPPRDLPPAPGLQGLLRRDHPHPRAAPARRTRAARDRPHAGRRRPRPALEPAEPDRGRDRAPPRRRRRRPRGDGRHRRHGRPLLPGRGDRARAPAQPPPSAAASAARRSATSSTSCRCRARTPPGSPSPARSRPASSTSSATSPRAWSTSRSPARCTSRSRPSAPTCTTSTARSAPSTAPRPCSLARDRGWI